MRLRLLLLVLALAVAACRMAPSGFVGPWFDEDGHPVPDGTDPKNDFALVLHVSSGPAHCGWQHAVFLHLAWPLGSVARSGDEFRQYIRDPEGVVHARVAAQLDRDAILPADARSTGYHRGDWELWVSPSDAKIYVYLVGPGHVERWPSSAFVPPDRRFRDLVLCK